MSTSASHADRCRGDRLYWYPFRPEFRWPMRMLGLFLAMGMISFGIIQKQWRWDSLVVPLMWLLWSFQTPRLRQKGGSFYLGQALLYVAIAVAVALLVVLKVADNQ